MKGLYASLSNTQHYNQSELAGYLRSLLAATRLPKMGVRSRLPMMASGGMQTGQKELSAYGLQATINLASWIIMSV